MCRRGCCNGGRKLTARWIRGGVKKTWSEQEVIKNDCGKGGVYGSSIASYPKGYAGGESLSGNKVKGKRAGPTVHTCRSVRAEKPPAQEAKRPLALRAPMAGTKRPMADGPSQGGTPACRRPGQEASRPHSFVAKDHKATCAPRTWRTPVRSVGHWSLVHRWWSCVPEAGPNGQLARGTAGMACAPMGQEGWGYQPFWAP